LQAEEFDAQVALRNVAQHPRHNPPPVKGFAICANRIFTARPTGHIVEGSGGKYLLGFLLQQGKRYRNRERTARQAGCVNLLLALRT